MTDAQKSVEFSPRNLVDNSYKGCSVEVIGEGGKPGAGHGDILQDLEARLSDPLLRHYFDDVIVDKVHEAQAGRGGQSRASEKALEKLGVVDVPRDESVGHCEEGKPPIDEATCVEVN